MLTSLRRFATTGASCVLIGAFLSSPAAFAALDDDPPTITVKFAELDLSRQEGAQELYRRIKSAAHAVCNATGGSFEAQRFSKHRQCFQTAVDDAVSRVNRPTLTALHKKQTPRLASSR